jgi:hypothetical protein
METKHLPIDLCELKFFDDDQWKVEGYASVFNSVDLVGDTILPGAFKKSLESGRRIGMQLEHLRWVTPGAWTDMYEDEKGLRVVGQLTRDHSVAKDLRASMRHGTIRGLSIGFWIPAGGAEQKGDNRIISEVDLSEVSFTASPAEPKAELTAWKSELAGINSLSDFEAFLRDSGQFSRSMATALTSHLKMLLQGDPARTQEEVKRISVADEIQAIANHYQLSILNHIRK